MGKFREVKADLWSFHDKPETVVFITTNGTLKQSNDLVMGRGCAKEAYDKFPGISAVLGQAIKQYGNQVMYFEEFKLGILPVKTQWYLKADIKLIENSLGQLLCLANVDINKGTWKNIVIPRPGCGNGGLTWEHEVKPLLEKLLDERFIIVTK